MSGKTVSMDQIDPKILEEFIVQATDKPMVPLHPPTEAMHIGDCDLPWIDFGDGVAIQLLKVDLSQGLWITRNRMKPGSGVVKHYHTGTVLAFTVQGGWYYSEYPDTVNRAGSFLYEPAGSCHTLRVCEDIEEDTIVWFAIYGANLNIDDKGNVVSIDDAFSVLEGYRAFCALAGESTDNVIVVGEQSK